MRARFKLLGCLLAAASPLAGCNLLFGIEPGELTGGAGGAGAGGAGAGGTGGQGATTSTTGNSTTAGGGGTGGTGGEAGTGGTGGSTGSCVPGAATCEGAVLHVCNDQGTPLPDQTCDVPAACDAAAKTCIDASTFPRLAVGASRACAIQDDRTLRCWGHTGAGIDLFGDQDNVLTAADVPDVSGVRQVTLEETQICALGDDGRVTCWGFNNSGEVTFPPGGPEAPGELQGVEGAVEIAAGYRATCARLADGHVTCWGQRASGCFGAVAVDGVDPPAVVPGVEGAVQLQAGSYYTPWCARLATGEVLCWSNWSDPTLMTGVDDATDIATGNGHVFIRSASKGLLWAGLSSNEDPEWIMPTPYVADDFVTFDAGEAFCGLKTDGAIVCADLGESGEPATPKPVAGLPAGTVAELVVGRGFLYDRDLQCLRLQGQPLSTAVYCWGDSFAGGLGANGPDLFREPVPVSGITTAASVTASQDATTVVLADGSVRQWGTSRALLGYDPEPTPKNISLLGTGNALIRSNDPLGRVYVLKTTGTLTHRDANGLLLGERLLGYATTGYADVLHFHRWDMALLATGEVLVYTEDAGSNVAGIRGDGTTTAVADTTFPVPGLTQIQAIAGFSIDDGASPAHACALQTGGALFCWGDNYAGQIGTGQITGAPVTTPTAVTIPDSEAIVSVAVGRAFTCAAGEGGKVFCWGDNGSGQLGFPGVSETPDPIEIPDLDGVVGLTAREKHVCAWLADKTARCWGENSSGQLGMGTLEDQGSPTPVSNLSAVESMTAGPSHTCARHTTGTVSCWGSAYRGQIGNGITGRFPTPLMVLGL